MYLSTQARVKEMPKLQNFHEICKVCQAGRQSRGRQSKTLICRALQILKLVYSDLVDPLHVASLNKSRYFVVFIDHYTRKFWVYFLIIKDETSDKF